MAVFEYDDNQHYVFLTVEDETVMADHSFGDEEGLVEALEDVIRVIKEGQSAE